MFSTREIKRLYYGELMSVNEISELLGCSSGLVVYRLNNQLRTKEEAGRIRTIKSMYGFIPKVYKDMKYI